MTKEEFVLINRLVSQLQHFRDRDGLQALPAEIAILLDEAHEIVSKAQPDIITQLCMDKFSDRIATREQE